MRKCIIFLTVLCASVFGQKISIVYLGVISGGAPEFEKRLDAGLREQITALPAAEVADYTQTAYLRKKTEFDDSPIISRSFIEALMSVSNDKTLVVWGDVKDFKIKPVRTKLIGAEVVGTLSFGLTMYSVSFKEHVYIGTVTCQARVKKPPVFFGNVEKNTSITASDRTGIIESVAMEATGKSADLIAGVVRSLMIKGGMLASESVEAKKVPSVSDLFDIPSVGAPDIESGDGKTAEKGNRKSAAKPEEPKKTEELKVPDTTGEQIIAPQNK